MIIREERPGDDAGVRALNIAAFARPDAPAVEADIVDALRAHGRLTLSLVAEEDGVIVGHVAFSPVEIVSPSGASWPSIGLGPIGVLPERQRQGIGSALVREGIERMRAREVAALFLLGHSEYYPRFGFTPAHRFGIEFPGALHPDAFQVIELVEGSLEGVSGVAKYGPEFDNAR